MKGSLRHDDRLIWGSLYLLMFFFMLPAVAWTTGLNRDAVFLVTASWVFGIPLVLKACERYGRHHSRQPHATPAIDRLFGWHVIICSIAGIFSILLLVITWLRSP